MAKMRILRNTGGLIAIQRIMLFVCAAVTVSVCAFAFRGYVLSMYQVKANETARKVRDAAAEYLALQERMGLLQEFNIKATYFGRAVGAEGREALFRSVYDEADLEAVLKRYKNVEFRYILLEAETAGRDNRADNPLFQMLENAVLDGNTRKHTFLIEYNTHTGEVLSAFYSEKADSFTYEGGQEEKENIIARDADSLKRKWQGYYAVDLKE